MLSIIIPVYNDQKIKQCLAALIPQIKNQAVEILVVDNNSQDPEIKKIITAFSGVKYIFETHAGSYCARNAGAQQAQGEVLAFIDSDCVVAPDWISTIIKNISQAAGLMGKIIDRNQNKIAELEGKFYQQVLADKRNVARIDTRNFIIKKVIFNELHGFNEKLKFGGDMEFGARLDAQGYNIKYLPSIIVQHQNETKFSVIINKRIKQNCDNYQIIKLHNPEFNKKYFIHLLAAPKFKYLDYFFKLILIFSCILTLITKQYYFFKLTNLAAIKIGLIRGYNKYGI